MAKRRNSHERLLMPKSTRWKEEEINRHAMFLGCLLMAVRGLGFLMLTWITVVLLGGFISNLGTADFWALTVIALLQIIGVFGLFHELKYRDIGDFKPNLFPYCIRPCCGCDSLKSMLKSLMVKLFDCCCLKPNLCLVALILVGLIIVAVLVMVVAFAAAFIVFTVGVAVMFGVVIPGIFFLGYAVVTIVYFGPFIVGIWSLVRLLVFRTLVFASTSNGPGMFGSKNDASQLPNLTPAVNAAYWLGVAQGVVLLYWHLCYHDRKRIVKDVTSGLGLESDSAAVWLYWQETAAGCEKDLTFAAGRNLMKYAVELLESKSPDKFLLGIRVLGTVISSRQRLLGRLVLTKQLLTGSASFCHLIEELLQILGPRSPYGMEIRGHAARIVLLVAHEIHLDEHPRCIQCVSSLLDPIESNKQNPPYAYQRAWQLRDTPYERDWCLEWYERDLLVKTCSKKEKSPESSDEGDDASNCDLQAKGYLDMVLLGLSVLEKLADDENNCSVMISTDGLLPRIMAPLCSNVLHLHGVDHEAWGRIVSKSLAVMCRLAKAPGEAGKTLRSNMISGKEDAIRTILERILQCHKCPALETAMELLTLLCKDASLGMQETTRGLIQFMLNIFADGNCKEDIRTLAGRKLALLSSQKADMILTLDGILDSLKDIFLSHPRSTLGIIAVEILDHLCEGNYTVDGECHKNMKNVMTAVMPQVLTELFRCDGSTEEATHTGIEEAISIAPEDEESQIILQGKNHNASSASHQQNREAELNDTIEWKKALLSLSAKFFDKYASNDDRNLPTLLNEVAPKLIEMAHANIQPTADSLRIMKLITKLAISLVRHGYLTEGVDNLMTSLTTASNKMLNLDGLLLCSGVEGGANKTFITFCSLVEEAQKLVYSRNAPEGPVVQDSSPRNN